MQLEQKTCIRMFIAAFLRSQNRADHSNIYQECNRKVNDSIFIIQLGSENISCEESKYIYFRLCRFLSQNLSFFPNMSLYKNMSCGPQVANPWCRGNLCACILNCFSSTLWDSMDCCLPGSPVHGILQAGILECIAMPSSRGSSQSRDWTQVSNVSCTGRWVPYH